MAATKTNSDKTETKPTPGMSDAEAPAYDPKQFAGWEEEKLGFAPYFQAREGAFFAGVPMLVEERQFGKRKAFQVTFKALAETQCFTGPVEDQTPVVVRPGEFFSVSVYEGLREKLAEYLTVGGIECMARCIEEVDLGNDQTFWKWSLAVSPASRKVLDGARKDGGALPGSAYRGQLNEKPASRASSWPAGVIRSCNGPRYCTFATWRISEGLDRR